MSEHKEGHVSGRDKLRGKKTVKEILEVATSFEKTAMDFYTALVPKVSKQIRYLVEELADEEKEHYDLFKGLANDPKIEKYLGDKVKTPSEDYKFSNFVQIMDLGDRPDDQSVLQYALAREHAAMVQYRELAVEIPEGPLRDLFEFLANEETKHKQELEKTYYQVVHSGGV